MSQVESTTAVHDGGRPFGVEIQQLLTFLAIYEERQVTLAARRLGRTPSALSHSLARLRELMGDELFIARAGEMWPSAEAQQLYPRIRQAVELIGSLQSKARAFDPLRDSLDLRIGMTDHAQKLFSPRIWLQLAGTAPRVRLIVHATNRFDAEARLLEGSLDLAIVGDPILTQPGVLHDELLSDEFVVASSLHGAPGLLNLDDYLAADHLRVAAKESDIGRVDEILRTLGHERSVRCIVPTYGQVPAMVENSSLLGTFARGIFAESSARLRLRPPPFEIRPVVIGLLQLHPAKSSSAQRWGADLVRAIARDLGPSG